MRIFILEGNGMKNHILGQKNHVVYFVTIFQFFSHLLLLQCNTPRQEIVEKGIFEFLDVFGCYILFKGIIVMHYNARFISF